MHKYPELTQRDRYQIGDWVLNNGKPYQWTADDYNRSRLGMQSIQSMPMTTDVLYTMKMKESNPIYDNGIVSTAYAIEKQDPTCEAHVLFVVIYVYTYHDGRPTRYILTAGHNYDSHDHRFNGRIHNVHELQSALRSVQLYDIAESIDLKQAESNSL